MFRNVVFAPFLVCLLVQAVTAQEWANKLFETRTHEYGTVARGAKTEFVFEMQNLYKEPIHIAGVRASCGCAMPSVLKETLQTWEKGGILVELNTRAFMGQRKATVTVTIDQPFYAEVQLTITGFIRGDVVFEPGTVNFDAVDQGAGATQTVSISYAGRSDWQILDVRSANTNLVVEPQETERQNGRVSYKLRVQLKADTPSGHFNDQMILVTNDQQSRQIPLRVQGNVVSPLTVSPASLSLGVVAPGRTVTRNIVVRGKQAFRVTGIHCDDPSIGFEPTDASKELHLIPVTFTAGEQSGKLHAEIRIETDLPNTPSGVCVVSAEVKPNEDKAETTQEASAQVQ